MNHDSFIQRLAKHIKSRYDLSAEELTVVFPNKRAAFYLRKEFQNQYEKNIWLPQMLSIQEAVAQWSGIALANTVDLLFELIDIDAKLHKEHDSDLSVFGSQAAQMAKDFDEIDQYGIDAEHLFNYVMQNKKLEIWNFDESKSKEKEVRYLRFFASLHDYYRHLRTRLSEKNLGYYGMITRHLAELPEETLAEKTGERKVVFAGFNALTTTEETLVEKLVSHGKAEIIFDFDRYYIDDPNNEAGLFARRYLERHPQWLQNGIADKLGTEEKQIHIISAGGNTLQAKALQVRLQAQGAQDDAVVLADENLLIPVLNAIPDNGNITDFKVSMGYPIAKTPVSQFIKSYFSLHRRNQVVRQVNENGSERQIRGWYIWPLLQTMSQELVRIIFKDAEFAAFEQWKTEQVANGKFIFEPSDIASLSHIPDIQEFIRLLLRTSVDKETPQEAIANISQLLRFISNKIQSKTNRQGGLFLLNQVSEIGKTVNRIAQVLERHADYLHDLGSVEILYRLLTSNTAIRLNSSSTDGLQIMGMLETRNIDFKRLHVLSVNEGILPAGKSQGSFIPHFIRKECGLPGSAEKQAVFAYHFYRLLQNGERIHLYYNNLEDLSGGEPSRFILQIRNELSRLGNIHIHEESFKCITLAPRAKSIQVEKAASMQRLKHLIMEHGLSPTSLSTYIHCPLKFFMKHIAQIKDNSVDEAVGTNIIGTIIHDTLESLFADFLPKDGNLQIIDKQRFETEILNHWEERLEQAVTKNMPYGFPDVGFNYLNKIIIKQQLKNYLEYTRNQLNGNELAIIETEGVLKATLATDHGDCLFSGRTDRIDRWNGVIRVIDYKTGMVENKDLAVPNRQPTDDDLSYLKSIPEKALQLLLYKYMYLKENQQIRPEQIKASIHGLRYANTIEFELANGKKSDVPPFWDEASFIDDMEALLRAVVNEMLDTSIPFTQAENGKKCANCEFKTLCKRWGKTD